MPSPQRGPSLASDPKWALSASSHSLFCFYYSTPHYLISSCLFAYCLYTHTRTPPEYTGSVNCLSLGTLSLLLTVSLAPQTMPDTEETLKKYVLNSLNLTHRNESPVSLRQLPCHGFNCSQWARSTCTLSPWRVSGAWPCSHVWYMRALSWSCFKWSLRR